MPSIFKVLRFCYLPLLALLLAGCGGGGSNGGGSGSPSPAAPLSVSAATPDGLTATLAESAANIRVGGGVTYTLTLTNDTNQPITITPYYAISASMLPVYPIGGSLGVRSPAGSIVYPPSSTGTTYGGGAVGSGPTVTLAPGKTAMGTVASVAVFPTPGTYAASATFSLYAGSANALQSTTVGPLNVTVQ